MYNFINIIEIKKYS